MSDPEARSPERQNLIVGAEPELVIRYRDPLASATGHAVIDTLATGIAFGGVRVSPTLDWKHLVPLARGASMRFQLARVSIGGARLGLTYDPNAPDLDDVLGRFLSSLRSLLERSISIGPDLHVSALRLESILDRFELPWRMEAVHRHQGWPAERWYDYQHILDQRTSEDATLRDIQVPYGVAQSVIAMGDFLFRRMPSVAVVGAGPYGTQIARLLQRAGASVVAVSGSSAGIYAVEGLQPDTIRSASDMGTMSLDSAHLYITQDEVFAMPVDVMVLAGAVDSVNIDNVGRIRANLIVEAAANSITRGAEKVLVSRGAAVLPNFAVTMGAVLIADAVLHGRVHTAEDALVQVADQVGTTIHELARLSATLRISLRDAGTRLAFHRWEVLPPPPQSSLSLRHYEHEPPEEL